MPLTIPDGQTCVDAEESRRREVERALERGELAAVEERLDFEENTSARHPNVGCGSTNSRTMQKASRNATSERR
jgi:hypothetical protein